MFEKKVFLVEKTENQFVCIIYEINIIFEESSYSDERRENFFSALLIENLFPENSVRFHQIFLSNKTQASQTFSNRLISD